MRVTKADLVKRNEELLKELLFTQKELAFVKANRVEPAYFTPIVIASERLAQAAAQMLTTANDIIKQRR